MSSVHQINEYVATECSLDWVVTCPHDDDDHCLCRKPRTGMLVQAAERFGITLDQSSVIIGDRWRDIDCGNDAGITTVHVYGDHDEPLKAVPDYSALSIMDAASWIIDNKRGK